MTIYVPGKVTLKYETVSPLLLDSYSGAAAAYSLRQLSWAYGGPVVRVRRDNDDAEQDFTATEVSDGTLAAWVGAGNDGFVRTWYDQSGNSRHAEQTTAANQPSIVSSGAVVLSGTKSSMSFDGANDVLNMPTLSASTQLFAFSVTSDLSYAGSTSVNARFFDVLAGSYSFQTLRDSSTSAYHMKNTYWQASTASTRFNAAPTALNLATNWFDSSANYYWSNGNSISSVGSPSSVSAAGSIGRIGARADLVSTAFLDGRFAELVLYQSDQSTNRTGIEASINAHYSIYP